MAGIGGQRDAHGPGPGDRHADRVGLEGSPGDDDLVAGLTDGVEQVLDEGDRAVADDDLLGLHAPAAGEGLREALPSHLRVTVDPGGGAGDGLDDRVLRRIGQLVGGELGDLRRRGGVGAGPGHVGGQGGDVGADAHRRRGALVLRAVGGGRRLGSAGHWGRCRSHTSILAPAQVARAQWAPWRSWHELSEMRPACGWPRACCPG